jgi:hypothetical protein
VELASSTTPQSKPYVYGLGVSVCTAQSGG